MRSTTNEDFWDEDADKLKVSEVVLQTDHLRDYSTNLLGQFQPRDKCVQLKKDGASFGFFVDHWQEGAGIEAPVMGIDFIINDSQGSFYLLIADLYEVEMVAYNDGTGVKPICKIIHSPTNANFWHCSLRWFYNGMDTICWSPKERRRILSTAKTFIVERAKRDEPIYEAIDPSDYT